jgi:uncharacterized membrane protein (DUF485 family)
VRISRRKARLDRVSSRDWIASAVGGFNLYPSHCPRLQYLARCRLPQKSRSVSSGHIKPNIHRPDVCNPLSWQGKAMNGVQGLETCADTGREKVGLALLLTFIEIVVFFGFISLAIISPAMLGAPISNGSAITVAFAYGLVILVVSVLLTGMYVLAENRNEA